MSLIYSAFLHKLNEIVMPKPDNIRILSEGFHCENNFRVRVPFIFTFGGPKPTRPSKSGDTTRGTKTCSSKYHNMLAVRHELGCLCSILHSYRLMNYLAFNRSFGCHLVGHASNEIIHYLAEVRFELLECLIDLLTLLNSVLDFLPQD